MAFWIQVGLNDAASPQQYGIIMFHDHCYFVLRIVLVGLLQYIGYLILNDLHARFIYEHSLVEFLWTIFPMVVISFLVIPSLLLLYRIDEGAIKNCCTVKAVGHQWYWEYQSSNLEGKQVRYERYMVPENELRLGEPRNLTADQALILPYGQIIRLLVTSADVLHSFAVPSLGAKADCIDGRLNVITLMMETAGILFGQCSELCGAGHRFIPISVKGVSLEDYLHFIGKQRCSAALVECECAWGKAE